MRLFFILFLALLTACQTAPAEQTPPPPAETTPTTEAVARRIIDDNPKNDPQPLDDMIRVTNVEVDGPISSPFVLRGEARGYWFSEGSFPVALLNEDGDILREAIAHPTGEWMTADFVPFTVELSYTAPAGTPATVELMLDNPAGPEEGRERSMIFPLRLE